MYGCIMCIEKIRSSVNWKNFKRILITIIIWNSTKMEILNLSLFNLMLWGLYGFVICWMPNELGNVQNNR